jgi:hypothetical protein
MIQCDLYSETEMRPGRVRQRLYKFVPAGGSTAFTALNVGFADRNRGRYACWSPSAKVIPPL